MCHLKHSVLSLSEPSLLWSHHILFLKSSALFSGLLTRWEVKWSESCSIVSNSLWPHGLYSPWNSPGQSTRVGILSLLQGIFPTWGSNPGFPHCRRILYQLTHKRSPRILEWVAYSLLQGIFPTQELNQGFLRCKWILYQLSYYDKIPLSNIFLYSMDFFTFLMLSFEIQKLFILMKYSLLRFFFCCLYFYCNIRKKALVSQSMKIFSVFIF